MKVQVVVAIDGTKAMTCVLCDEKLRETVWNTDGNILVCDNIGCMNYRAPQGWVSCDNPLWRISRAQHQKRGGKDEATGSSKYS